MKSRIQSQMELAKQVLEMLVRFPDGERLVLDTLADTLWLSEENGIRYAPELAQTH